MLYFILFFINVTFGCHGFLASRVLVALEPNKQCKRSHLWMRKPIQQISTADVYYSIRPFAFTKREAYWPFLPHSTLCCLIIVFNHIHHFSFDNSLWLSNDKNMVRFSLSCSEQHYFYSSLPLISYFYLNSPLILFSLCADYNKSCQ